MLRRWSFLTCVFHYAVLIHAQLEMLYSSNFSNFIAVKIGRLHYKSMERAKLRNLKASRGNFDKTMVLDGQSKLDILL